MLNGCSLAQNSVTMYINKIMVPWRAEKFHLLIFYGIFPETCRDKSVINLTWNPRSAALKHSRHWTLLVTQPLLRKNAAGTIKATPIIRPHILCAYSM